MNSQLIPPMNEITRDDGKTYIIVKEGLAEILSLKHRLKNEGLNGQPSKVQDVFYNPIQQFNRDLSVLAIRAFAEDLAVVREGKQRRKRLNGNETRGQVKRQKRKREVEDENEEFGRTPKKEEESDTEQNPRMKKQDDEMEAKGKRDLKGNLDSHADSMTTESSTLAPNVSNDGTTATSTSAQEEREPPPRPMNPFVQPNHSSISESNPSDYTSPPKFPFRILDALSATGLRAIRYVKEIPNTTMVTANDLSAQATASIRLNVSHNEIADKVNVLTGDARAHMYQVGSSKGEPNLYEVIDLDPYGTAAPFFDAAVRAVIDGGLLCVTCTDAGVFASTGYLEKTFSQYGGLPLKGLHSHEGGLRIILHGIAVSAARYGLSIEPLLSLSIDFYIRVFVRVYRSPAEVKFFAGKTMAVYNCDEGCGAWKTQYLAQTRAIKAKNGGSFYKFTLAQAPSTNSFCEHCGFKTHLSGPMWGGPIHNPHFIRRILDALPSLDKNSYGTIPRIEGMLSVAYQEALFGMSHDNASDSDEIITRPVPQTEPTLRDNHPFFFNLCTLAGILHCVGPSDAVFCAALKRLGYRTGRSHAKAGSIRTDAPWSVVWEVMREWMRQKAPVKETAIRKGTAGWGIMQQDRSKVALNSVKSNLKQILEKSEDLRSMRTELEATLYRLREAEAGGEAGAESTSPSLPPPPPPPPPSTAHAAATTTATTTSTTTDTNALLPPPKPVPTTPPPPPALHELNISFAPLPKERTLSPPRKIVRYQMNPRPDWGPISRARGR